MVLTLLLVGKFDTCPPLFFTVFTKNCLFLQIVCLYFHFICTFADAKLRIDEMLRYLE